MASIRKVRGRWQVRWHDPDGRARSRMCPTRRVAETLRHEVEEAHALGRRWELPGVAAPADLEARVTAFIVDADRTFKPGTSVRIALAMQLFRRFRDESGVHLVAQLSRQVLADFNAWLALPRTSRHGKVARDAETVRKNTSIVQRMWQWAYDNDETGTVPPPRKLKMPSPRGRVTVAPTWAEMDACIAACATEWHRQLAILMRFTGLRVNQALALIWADFDLERATLTIRGELGKTAQEMRGRVVPISLHLVAILKTWGNGDGYVVKSKRMKGVRARAARARDMERAWMRAGVRVAARLAPNHAFRKGFVSGLKRAGADNDAVEVLVGHSLNLRGVYLDPDAVPLREAVTLIPPLASNTKNPKDAT